MCSTVQEQITTCGQNAIVKIGERTNIRPQKYAIQSYGYINSLGTRCPCTLKLSLLSKITYINTVRFAFKINSLDKICKLVVSHCM